LWITFADGNGDLLHSIFVLLLLVSIAFFFAELKVLILGSNFLFLFQKDFDVLGSGYARGFDFADSLV